jgi:hypothetical protein
MARSIECKCEYNFTCGYCLRNAAPLHTTSYNPVFYSAALGFVGEKEESTRREGGKS